MAKASKHLPKSAAAKKVAAAAKKLAKKTPSPSTKRKKLDEVLHTKKKQLTRVKI
jgi:hypothetical protein